MRTRWIVLGLGCLFLGTMCGSALTPTPVGAVSKEMIQLQTSVDQLTQSQQSLRSAVDANNATLRTLIQQATDSVNQLNGKMALVEKTVQEVQANTGARIDTMTTQTQGLSDNVQDIQARVGKLSQQMNDIQSLLQSIDAKISGGCGAPACGAGAVPAAEGAAGDNGRRRTPALCRRFRRTRYTRTRCVISPAENTISSRQEFRITRRISPRTIWRRTRSSISVKSITRKAITKLRSAPTSKVISQYPRSFKVAASQLKKAQAEIKLGRNRAGIRDLHEVVRKYPGTPTKRGKRKRDCGSWASPSATR